MTASPEPPRHPRVPVPVDFQDLTCPDAYIRPKNWTGTNDAGQMTSSWWHDQLPQFWLQIQSEKKGFQRTPYLPIPWTDWQIKQFDDAPLIGHVYRPVTVSLHRENGVPLDRVEVIAALAAGIADASRHLDNYGEFVKRVIYDTFADKHWVVPLGSAVAAGTHDKLAVTDPSEGYDLGMRIGDLGNNSELMQIGLGLVASFEESGGSISVARRPNGKVDITAVSSVDEVTKNKARANSRNQNPF